MTPAFQSLIVVIGCLITALLTLMVTGQSGLRIDVRSFGAKLEGLSNRLIKLETAHEGRYGCGGRRVGDHED